jgi:hypothetical protein
MLTCEFEPLYVKYGEVNVIFDIVPFKPLPLKSLIVVPVPEYDVTSDGSKYKIKLFDDVGVGVGVSVIKDQTTFPFRNTLVAEEPLKYILLLFPNKLMLIDYNV